MKARSLKTLASSLCLLALGMSPSLNAQLPMSSTLTQPGVGPYDQYYLPGAVVEGTDTIASPFAASGNNDQYTYISTPDRQSKAQSFTTGPSPLGYNLKSFTFQQADSGTAAWLNNGTFFLLTSGDSVSVRVGSLPSLSSLNYTPILTTNATYTGTTYNTGGTTSALGVYLQVDLSNAHLPTLAPNTTYFVEMMASGSDHWEINNTSTNPSSTVFPALYTNGAAMSGNTTAGLDATGAFSVPPNGGEFAFVASITAVGQPTVVATLNPAAAAPGQTFTVTATVTPGVGTVTNVSVNLSSIGGAAVASLVLSNNNVYTNTFTVPNGATAGITNLSVTATQNTQPLIGVANLAFNVFPPSPPSVVNDTSPVGAISLYASEGVLFTASFSGVPPITYNWQASPDGSTFTNIPNATNTSFTISAAQVADSGYYRLLATDAFGSTPSTPTSLTVTAGTPTFTWSAPIPFGGLTAEQILTNFPGTTLAGALVAQNGGSPITVTLTNDNNFPIVFGAAGTWATLAGGTGYTGTASTNGPALNNSSFAAVLSDKYFDNGTHTITLNGLVPGQHYSVQLFALDDTGGYTPPTSQRFVDWQDPVDSTDTSETYAMLDNSYIVGTFTATSSSQVIQENMTGTGGDGNFNALVLRAIGFNPPPYITLQPQSSSAIVGTTGKLLSSAADDITAASPAITYQWQAGPSGGPYTNLVSGSKYTNVNSTNLLVNNLTTGDAAYYFVLVASNAGGSTTSAVANLTIVVPVQPAAGSYGAAALALGPVAFWQLNENIDPSSGVLAAYDYTGNGYNGTYGVGSLDLFDGAESPQPPQFPGFASGQGGLSTTGAANSVVTLPSLNLNTNAVTIAMWIDPTAVPGAATGLLFNRGGPDAAGLCFSAATDVNGNRSLGYTWNNAAATYNWNAPLYPQLNTWSFVVLVVQSNKTTIYLDYYDPNTGNPLLTSASIANTATSEAFTGGVTRIGGDSLNANRTFTGGIAGVAVYKSALSSSQIAQLFGAGVGTNTFVPDIYPQPPASTTVYAGYTLQITAGASGSAPITNQWQLGGINLSDGTFGGVTVVGSQSNVLTIKNITTAYQGNYTLAVSNSIGYAISSADNVTVLTGSAPLATNVVGQWLAGTPTFADVSGFSPQGTHDAYDARLGGGTRFFWTNDVPPSAPQGSLSLHFGNDALFISNSSTLDAAYVSTYDVTISNTFSVSFWAKGWPGGWNPFVSKYGEGPGWQLRNDGNNNVSPTWTIRGNPGTVTIGTPVFGNAEDDAATSLTYGNDGQWHFYCGTYDVNAGARNLYVDGNLVAQTSGEGQYNTAPVEHLALGGKDSPPGNTPGNYFTGLLYDVRIYDVALTADQAAYVGINPPSVPALVAPTVTTLIGGLGGTNLVLSWQNGNLESTTNLAGPWTIVTSIPPYTNALTGPQKFFRVVLP